MARKCGECRRYHTNRYHESICGLTGKNVGFLWEAKEDCFEAIALPETPAEENKGLTSDDNKMAQDANKTENTPRLKVCKECGRELPIESFQIIGRHKAVNSICKECQHKKAAATKKAKLDQAIKEEKAKEEAVIAEAVSKCNDEVTKRNERRFSGEMITLHDFSDPELVAELRNRGWEVRCTKVIEL